MSEKSEVAALLRQGDVLLIPVESVPVGEGVRRTAVDRVDGRLVLAEGEATGHAHAIDGDGAALMRVRLDTGRRNWGRPVIDDLGTFLVVEEPELLRHEEHDPILVEPGIYEVRRQREYRPQAAVWVRD